MEHKPYFRSRPNAEIGVLLIHGILSTPRHFDFLISQIPDGYEVSSILLAGHGGTVKEFSQASMTQWKHQAASEIERLQQHCRKIILIGHSLGSLLAMDAACKFDCIHSLILLNPPLIPRLQFSMLKRSFRFAFGKIDRSSNADMFCYNDLSIHLEPYLWKYMGWIPNFLSLLRLARKCRGIPKKLQVPCIAFLGTKDELVHPNTARYLKENTYHLLENGFHFGYTPEQQQFIFDKIHPLLHID